MFKLYLPSGHLEESAVELLKETGLRITISHRSCTPKIENFDYPAKMIRPQDAPLLISLGKADLAITGSDIYKEFILTNPNYASKISIMLDLPTIFTKFVLAISKEVFPLVTTLSELLSQVRKQGRSEIVVATEYPTTTQKFLARRGVTAINLFTSYGQTESWIIPPNPEADLIADTVSTGKTLSENNCQIIETIQENYPILIVNRESLEDNLKKIHIDEFAVHLRRAIYKIKEKEMKLKQAQLPLPETKVEAVPAY
jgi:ATP phosphoribosyltransferase